MSEKNKYGYSIGAGCKAFAITPSDTADQITSGIVKMSNAFQVYVGTTGNVSVICAEDSTPVTFTGVPAGTFLPVLVSRVRSTSTTATNLVGIY
jgi:hypothetical protein